MTQRSDVSEGGTAQEVTDAGIYFYNRLWIALTPICMGLYVKNSTCKRNRPENPCLKWLRNTFGRKKKYELDLLIWYRTKLHLSRAIVPALIHGTYSFMAQIPPTPHKMCFPAQYSSLVDGWLFASVFGCAGFSCPQCPWESWAWTPWNFSITGREVGTSIFSPPWY